VHPSALSLFKISSGYFGLYIMCNKLKITAPKPDWASQDSRKFE